MTAESSTIAGLLTPLAPGAIALIGLAGPATETILRRILRKHQGDGPVTLRDRRPSFCRIVDRGKVLDDAVVVRIDRDGLMTAELNTHGGVRIAQRTLLLLADCGARIVDGQAFCRTQDTSNPVEQAVDRALLDAASRRLTRWLLAQRMLLPGFLSGWTSLSDQQRADFRRSSDAAVRLVGGLHVAVVGPPNAGKSTLANRLIGSDRVITSDQAGTTRDWVSETALVCGWPVTLTDTAGLRETNCAIEAEAIRRGRARAQQADAIIIVIDAALPTAVQQQQTSDVLATLPLHVPKLLAQNKCDLPGAAAATIPNVPCCPISALSGRGTDDLEKRLASILALDRLGDSKPAAFLPGQLP